MKSALALTAVVLAVVAASAQTPPQTPPRDQPRVAVAGSAIVTGAVVADDETRAPLRHATVTLSRSGIEDIRSTTTDDQGKYVFDHLPAGSYVLSAAKGAYLAMRYGAPRPGMPGSSVVVAEGETFTAKPMALLRGAVIAGRLFDRWGQPAAFMPVEAVPLAVVNGRRRRRTVDRPLRATTNAHGEYRIYGLSPAEYAVTSAPPRATMPGTTAAEFAWAHQPTGQAPPPGRTFIHAPTMFPGTTDASAGMVLTLRAGEERLGVDFALQAVPVARVSGIVTGPDGRQAPDVTVMCVMKDSNLLLAPSGIPVSRTGPDGAFTCRGLPPGQYQMAARVNVRSASPIASPAMAGGASQPTSWLWGAADVTVAGQDVANVAIQLEPGRTVSGRVVFDRLTPGSAVDLTRFAVGLAAVGAVTPNTGAPSAAVAADGSFQIPEVMPGAYRLTATSPAESEPGRVWQLRSAMLDGRDVADVAFDVAPGQSVSGLVVTFSQALPELSGVLTDSAGRPAALYVFMFPTDKTLWTTDSRRVKATRANDAGAYAIAGLPPGDYYLCALTELDATLQFEPEYLEQLVSSSIKITLGEGEKKKQDLRIGG